MPRKNRKISFHYLEINNPTLDVKDCYNQTISHIANLTKLERKSDINYNKFGLLDIITSLNGETRYQLVFKSATHNFRPPLIDRNTVEERDSPKRIEEGETQKTHLISKAINGNIVIILEKHMHGMTIKQIVQYLNSFSRNFVDPYIFSESVIIKDNFLEEVNSLDRITIAELLVDKQMLGSEAMNYSDRTSSVKHEVEIKVKAVNRENISEFAKDVYAKFNGGQRQIKRIKITGRNEDNNIVILNTDEIERQEFVTPNIDENTGEVITSEILQEMEVVMFNFN